MRRLLDQIEWYYDAVPRCDTRVESFGPLTLFVREGQGWPFAASEGKQSYVYDDNPLFFVTARFID